MIADSIRNLLCHPDQVVILDTETTGFDSAADEILQLSIMDLNDNVLYNGYFKPLQHESWEDAEMINHISPETVKDAPTIDDERSAINHILSSAKLIVGYNASFDLNFLHSAGIQIPADAETFDVMEEFAPIYGEWIEKRKTYRWQKLVVCADYYGYSWEGSAHDSLADCRATLHCFKKMMEAEERKEEK